jgi:hypothetical protein
MCLFRVHFILLFGIQSLSAAVCSTSASLGFDLLKDGNEEMTLSSNGLRLSGNLTVSQGLIYGIQKANDGGHIQNSMVLSDSSSSNVFLTLPHARNVAGQVVEIKNASGQNDVYIGSASNIDTGHLLSLLAIVSIPSFAKVVSDGSKWHIMSTSFGVSAPSSNLISDLVDTNSGDVYQILPDASQHLGQVWDIRNDGSGNVKIFSPSGLDGSYWLSLTQNGESAQLISDGSNWRVIGSSVSASTNITPADNLVLHYDFNETSGVQVTDKTGNGFTGELNDWSTVNAAANDFTFSNNSITGIASGGRALRFDGHDDFLKITRTTAGNEILDLDSDYTMTFLYQQALDAAETTIFSACNSTKGTLFSLRFGFDTGSAIKSDFRLRSYLDGGNGTLWGAMNHTNLANLENQWLVLTVTRAISGDNVIVMIYINGAQVATKTEAMGEGSIFSYENDNALKHYVLMRGENTNGDKYGEGYIDDFKIYNRVLSQNEITDLHQQALVTP